MTVVSNARSARASGRRALIVAATVAALTPMLSPVFAAPGEPADGYTYAQPAIAPAQYTGDLSKLPPLSPAPPRAPSIRPLLLPPSSKVAPASAFEPQPAAPVGPLAPMPGPLQNFAGMSFADSCTGGPCGAGWPPDTNGDVGPRHYIQAVNSAYAIYSKTGTLLAAFTEDNLWQGTSQPQCDGNSQGDPIVVYDRLADRWILSHFAFSSAAGPFYQCIAASKTSDPVAGGWWLYAVRMDPGGIGLPANGYLADYPKFGVWHDCLYLGANEFLGFGPFRGAVFGTFSRADLYSGAPLTYGLGFVPASANIASMFPSTDAGGGPNAALPGTPNYYVSESQTAFNFEVRKLTAGPNCGGGGTLGAATIVSQTAYPFANFGTAVPQPNTAQALDNIDDRIMQKVQYRRIGSTESLWITHNVDTASGTTAMQWAQINVTGGTVVTTPVQQQIYAPDTTLYRWMGSLAVDAQGNMALGFSTSNGTSPNFPSIAYAGRLATDPLATLPRTEVQLVAGGGSQTVNERWGDYSAMSIDPADDCTFWYTNEYYDNQTSGTSGNWHTRIGSFKFPSCVAETTRVLVPDGTSEKQTFASFPETRWFALTVEPGKTYVVDTVDPSGDLVANAIGTLDVYGADGVTAPPEASVDCAGANAPRPPSLAVAGDGIRCVVRTAPPVAGSQQNKRPVYVKVTRGLNEASQFRIRAREATIYGRWLTAGNFDYHVEVENSTADPMCVEVARYPASGLTYATSWAGAVDTFTMSVPAFGAVKQVISHGSLVGPDTEGTLRIGACAAPTNLVAGGLHVSTYAFDAVANQYIYFFTTPANDGKTRNTF